MTDLTKKGQPNKVVWSEVHNQAFQKLKGVLCSDAVLKLPDLHQPFIIRTDASNRGLGAVLLQEDEGLEKPVAYASRKLLPRECNYSTIERECLGIVWGILKFQKYLYGKEFKLETDHLPLQWLQQKKSTNSRLMRWALSLQPYRLAVRYIKGNENVGADYLSRV